MAFLLMVVSANAFQETSSGQAARPAAAGDESGLGLAEEDGSPAPGSVASSLPNLNFGLELLYGGKASPNVMTDDDPVGLRLRHTF